MAPVDLIAEMERLWRETLSPDKPVVLIVGEQALASTGGTLEELEAGAKRMWGLNTRVIVDRPLPIEPEAPKAAPNWHKYRGNAR